MMRCETCKGRGEVWSYWRKRLRPCPTCGGTGFDACCGGDTPNPYDEGEREDGVKPGD